MCVSECVYECTTARDRGMVRSIIFNSGLNSNDYFLHTYFGK